MLRAIAAPTDLAGCVLWLDAATGVTADGSNKVSQWSDQSGAGNHVTQGNASLAPTVLSSVLNGRPGIQFVNANSTRLERLNTNLVAAGHSYFVVVRVDANAATGADTIFANHQGGASGVSLAVTGGGNFNASHDGVISQIGTTIPIGLPTIASVRHPAVATVLDTLRFGRAASQVNTSGTAAGYTDPGSTANLMLGARRTSGGAYSLFASCTIFEVVVFNRTLTEGEAALVERYLAKKWAILPDRRIASPLEIQNCALWLDAGLGVTESGGVVSQWSDQSGNANHAAQSNASLRPTVTTFSGQPVISFNGSTQYVTLTSNLTNVEATAFAVARYRDTPTGSHRALLSARQNAIYATAPPNGEWAGYTGTEISSGEFMTTALRVHTFRRRNETTSNVAVRSAGVRRAVGSNNSLVNRGQTDIGASVGVQHAPLDLSALLFFNRALSDGEVALVESYLKRRFAL